MSEKEISAIDAVYKILDELEEIKKRQLITDNNIKLLNNKLSKLLKDSSTTDESKKPAGVHAVVPKTTASTHKVYGFIKSSNKAPIKDVDVTIYNELGVKIKSTKTDSTGQWADFLQNGKYQIEYSHAKFSTINRNITVENADLEVK